MEFAVLTVMLASIALATEGAINAERQTLKNFKDNKRYTERRITALNLQLDELQDRLKIRQTNLQLHIERTSCKELDKLDAVTRLKWYETRANLEIRIDDIAGCIVDTQRSLTRQTEKLAQLVG
jgi:hypothetical protein